MLRELRFSQLSRARQIFVRLCQLINYGSILNIRIVNGDFDFDGSAEVTLDRRLDDEVVARRELLLPNFILPAESCRLFAHIDSAVNGMAEKITIQAGVPRRLILRRSVPNEVIQ